MTSSCISLSGIDNPTCQDSLKTYCEFFPEDKQFIGGAWKYNYASDGSLAYLKPRLMTNDVCRSWVSSQLGLATPSIENVCRSKKKFFMDDQRIIEGTAADLDECGCIVATDQAFADGRRYPSECLDNRCTARGWKTYPMTQTKCNIVDCSIVANNNTYMGDYMDITFKQNCGIVNIGDTSTTVSSPGSSTSSPTTSSPTTSPPSSDLEKAFDDAANSIADGKNTYVPDDGTTRTIETTDPGTGAIVKDTSGSYNAKTDGDGKLTVQSKTPSKMSVKTIIMIVGIVLLCLLSIFAVFLSMKKKKTPAVVSKPAFGHGHKSFGPRKYMYRSF